MPILRLSKHVLVEISFLAKTLDPAPPLFNRLKQPYTCWLSTVDEYLDRVLTFFTDLFPAISGLAQEIQTRLPPEAEYAAGILLEDWQRGIPSSLMDRGRVRETYIAPP
jgi:hypothetical protein